MNELASTTHPSIRVIGEEPGFAVSLGALLSATPPPFILKSLYKNATPERSTESGGSIPSASPLYFPFMECPVFELMPTGSTTAQSEYALVRASEPLIGRQEVNIIVVTSMDVWPSANWNNPAWSLASTVSSPSMERRVTKRYRILEPEKVWQFLTETASPLIEVLVDAIPFVETIFGAGTVITLVINDDPEESATSLFAEISTSVDAASAVRLMRKFDREWFLNQVSRVNGLLNFSLSFE